ALVEEYVRPLLRQGADTLVLGCTHYPFLEAVVRDVAGPDVTIVDPSAAVARELRRRLEANALLTQRTEPGGEHFWTSGAPEAVQPVVDRLWLRRVDMRSAHPW
ncbi:MAG: glutamate racemase, partial [Vicinamibacterales bacterium]